VRACHTRPGMGRATCVSLFSCKTPTPSTPFQTQASKLIMDHMAKEPFELTWWPLALLAASAANSAGGDGDAGLFAPPPAFDVAILGLAAAGYLHYVLSVISETCGYLGIRCLAITPVACGDGTRARRAAAAAAGTAAARTTQSSGRRGQRG